MLDRQERMRGSGKSKPWLKRGELRPGEFEDEESTHGELQRHEFRTQGT